MFSRLSIVGLSAGSIGLALTLSSSAVAAPYTDWAQPYADSQSNVQVLLHMNESSGTNAANTGGLGGLPNGTYSPDATGNVASGAGIPASGFGNAFDSNSSSSLSIPSDPSFVDAFSDGYVIEMWFKADSLSSRGALASKYTGSLGFPGGRQFLISLETNGTLYSSTWRSDGVEVEMFGTTTINAGEWHHVAIQYDSTQAGGNRWEMFLDGNLETSVNAGAAGFTTAANPIWIGSYDGPSLLKFDGQIDEFRISSGQYDFQPVPEPASLSLIALAGLLAKRRK